MIKKKARVQKYFMDSLLNKKANCEIKVDVWYPDKKETLWLLGLKLFKAEIHPKHDTIIELYNGSSTVCSTILLTLYFHEKDLEYLYIHEKLKSLYKKKGEEK